VREHDRGRDVLVGQPGGTGGGRLLVGVGAASIRLRRR